uniref:Uncharacterized protein n=1 Tax=Anguilla anguilla TaxID=7936 RepID=A0A0E9PS16_ANGAN
MYNLVNVLPGPVLST